MLNNPNNPTGKIYSRKALDAVADVLREAEERFGHTIYLICDEPYRELVYDGSDVPFPGDYYADSLIAYSWSKSLSMPCDRIGYVAVPKCAGLEALYPQGAFYMWIKSPVENEYDFVSAAKKERILITPGSAFNGPGWVRASFCGKNETIQNSKESWMNLGKRFNLI